MRFSALDSLRGISAVLIILFHIEDIGAIYAGHLHGITLIEHCFFLVDFFFVLSGFVISYTYFTKIRTRKDVKKFMIRRFGRIYPLHAVMLGCFLLLELLKLYAVSRGQLNHQVVNAPFTKDYTLYELATSLLLLQAMNLHEGASWNAPSWTISVEFYTYMVFVLFTLLAQNKPRVMVAIAAAIISASAMILALYSPHYMNTIYDYAIFRCFYGFFCGVLAQFIYRSGVFSYDLRRLGNTLLEVAITAAIITYIYFTTAQPASLLAPFVFIPFILVFSRQGGAISRVLQTKPLLRIGNASYTLYITHAFIILISAKLLRVAMDKGKFGISLMASTGEDGQPVSLLTCGNMLAQDMIVLGIVSGVFAVSFVLRRVVEEPCRIYFYKISGGR